jgi:hypothetical protein
MIAPLAVSTTRPIIDHGEAAAPSRTPPTPHQTARHLRRPRPASIFLAQILPPVAPARNGRVYRRRRR